MPANTPVTTAGEHIASRYSVTLSTHGRRALLASGSGSFGRGRVPTPLGNAAAAAWLALPQAFPQLATEALYLTPDSICAIVTVSGAGKPSSLRLLSSAIRLLRNRPPLCSTTARRRTTAAGYGRPPTNGSRSIRPTRPRR